MLPKMEMTSKHTRAIACHFRDQPNRLVREVTGGLSVGAEAGEEDLGRGGVSWTLDAGVNRRLAYKNT
jgi:hypothetical protein